MKSVVPELLTTHKELVAQVKANLETPVSAVIFRKKTAGLRTIAIIGRDAMQLLGNPVRSTTG